MSVNSDYDSNDIIMGEPEISDPETPTPPETPVAPPPETPAYFRPMTITKLIKLRNSIIDDIRNLEPIDGLSDTDCPGCAFNKRDGLGCLKCNNTGCCEKKSYLHYLAKVDDACIICESLKKKEPKVKMSEKALEMCDLTHGLRCIVCLRYSEYSKTDNFGCEFCNIKKSAEEEDEEPKPITKLLGIDLDGTLVDPENPKNTKIATGDDIRLKYQARFMRAKLDEYKKKGYKPVIMSNQLGISKGQTTLEDFKKKIAFVESHLGKLDYLYAPEDDMMRKPRPGMWEAACQKFNLSGGIYVGDAAGREIGGLKDHASSDYDFARNVGAEFFTPEKFFFDIDDSKFWKHSDPVDIPIDDSVDKVAKTISKSEKLIVILVGSPGSGKSSFAQKLADFVVINNDTMKKSEQTKAIETAILEGKNIVFDNTNPMSSSRMLISAEEIKAEYDKKRNVIIEKNSTKVAEAARKAEERKAERKKASTAAVKLADVPAEMNIDGYKRVIVHFDISKDICIHMNTMRKLTSDKSVPTIAINKYYSQLTVPTTTTDNVEKVFTIKGYS